MKEATIEELAYAIKQIDKHQPKPIFFLGAGASESGGIPLAQGIVDDILKKHSKAPEIKKLDDKEHYVKLMECFSPSDRKK